MITKHKAYTVLGLLASVINVLIYWLTVEVCNDGVCGSDGSQAKLIALPLLFIGLLGMLVTLLLTKFKQLRSWMEFLLGLNILAILFMVVNAWVL